MINLFCTFFNRAEHASMCASKVVDLYTLHNVKVLIVRLFELVYDVVVYKTIFPFLFLFYNIKKVAV